MSLQRSNTLVRNQVKAEVYKKLEGAENTKEKSLPDALNILYDTAQLLPKLAADNVKGSARNVTQDRFTQEIQYMSKRGNILYELKDYEEAQKCSEAIKAKLPQNVEIYKALGDCLRKQNKCQEASEIYNKGLAIAEKDDVCTNITKAALLNSRGLNYMEQREYAKAKADFEEAVKLSPKNPLFLCNKGYALYGMDKKDEALGVFGKVNELVSSGQVTSLTPQNIEYIKKTIKECVEGINVLKSVTLEKPDEVMKARELGYIKSSLLEQVEQGEKETVEESDKEQSENITVEQLKKIRLTIKSLQEGKDQKLYEYYDGFMFTLSQLYGTAVTTSSGQIPINTNQGAEIDILAAVIQLIPIVGSQLSNGVQNLASYVKETEVNRRAVNITRFATNQTMFDGMVQDVLLELIEAKQDQIRAQDEDDLDKFVLPKLTSSYRKMLYQIKKLKGKADEILYGNRNETALQKLGYRTANTLVSEYIASGTIYNGEKAISISIDEKKKRLLQHAMELFEKSLNKTVLTELEDFTESRAQCESCRMF